MTAEASLRSANLSVPSALALFRHWADRGECLGGQLFVAAGGTVVADAAVGRSGLDRKAAVTDMGRLYCAVKPLTACLLARAVEAGSASFDDAARRFLPEFSGRGRDGITLRQLLSHTSGLFDYWLDPYDRGFANTVRLACRYPLPERSWYRAHRYNDVLAWTILGAVVERLYGTDLATVVTQAMELVPGHPRLCMTSPDPGDYVSCHIRRDGAFQVLPEPRPAVMFGTVNPAHGGFASARDLGLLYTELLRCVEGTGSLLGRDRARELVRQHSLVDFGSGQERACGLGFMTGVRGDGIGGGWSSDSFGHAGYISQFRVVHAFADPRHDVAVVMRLFSTGSKNNWRFHRLGEALWAELALS